MYGYQDDTNVTPEQVLQKVSQEEIFEFVLGEPFNYGAKYISPFREGDTRPGCRLQPREDGVILFIDFGEEKGNTHRTCFKMVMHKYHVDLHSAVNIIIEHFDLNNKQIVYPPLNPSLYYKSDKTPKHAIIHYDIIPYVKRDKLFWSQFLIRVEELLEDHVYSTNKFSITRDEKTKTSRILAPCYAIDFLSRVKLYQPYSTNYRWITNCDENNIGNFDNLPPTGEILIIQKSYKDHRVIRNLLLKLSVIWFQNEGCVPSIEILRNLVERFTTILVFFDNDEAGTKAAIKLVNILNSIKQDCAEMIHLPIFVDRSMQWKDPAAFISKEGQKDLLTIFKQILSWQNIHL